MADLLRSRPNGPAALRRLLESEGVALLPGCYDALSARLIEMAGFEAAYMTGFGTSASLLGRPDIGLLTSTEMVDNLGRIVRATDLPVLADADTGYGSPLNVIRTVQEYEQTGAAGLHIEDQVMPKRCGHMADKEVVSAGEFEARIEAATAARSSPDFVIIARTDARAPLGLSAAIDRARRARAAGADAVFVEALETEAELETAADELAGAPLIFNWVDGGRTPVMALDRLDELGFVAALLPIAPLLAATTAIRERLATIRAIGLGSDHAADANTLAGFNELIGMAEIEALTTRFRTEPGE